jgi:hypothetical protein
MGIITRAAANNITTGGVILPAGINDASVASVTALAQVSAGDGITLISSQTASSSASLSFTTGIDSTYRTYMFKFINMHASAQGQFEFQASTNGGSSYGVTLTSTLFQAEHYETDSSTFFDYNGGRDLAQSTSYQFLNGADLGTNNDDNFCGTMSLFSPSSTTYVKHFISQGNVNDYSARCTNTYIAGYFNTTSALNAISFRMSTGNIDAGTILMYGIA